MNLRLRRRTSAALYPRRGTLEYCELERHNGSISTLRQEEVPWTAPPLELDIAQWAQALAVGCRALADKVGDLPDRVTLCIPSPGLLFKTMSLPTSERGEIEQMLQLQLDKLSPYAIDLAMVSYEVIERTENESHLLVAIAAAEQIEQIVAAVRGQALWLDRIDVDALAIWRQIAGHQIVPPGAVTAVVWADAENSFLMICDRVPVLVRSLACGLPVPDQAEVRLPAASLALRGAPEPPAGPAAATPDAPSGTAPDPVDVITAELEFSSAALEAERGTSRVEQLLLFDPLQRFPASAVQALQKAAGIPVVPVSLQRFPVSAARASAVASLAPETGPVDLLPAAWHQRYRGHVRQTLLWRGALALLALYFAGFVVFASLLHARSRRLATIEASIRELEPQARALAETRQEVETLERAADLSRSPLEALLACVRAMPPQQISIERFDYVRDRRVQLRGVAGEQTLITEYIDSLKLPRDSADRPLFSAVVQTGPIRTENRPGARVHVFDLECSLGETTPAQPTQNAPAPNPRPPQR